MNENGADLFTSGFCVIMAGGRGTRFWPLSRTARPKQLLKLASEQTLLRETFERVESLVGVDRILVVTAGELGPACRRELPELPAEQVVAEPVGRNTAPCAVLGMGLARCLGGDAPVALLPADHHIPDAEIFREQLARAFAQAARTASVVTFGIPPDRPETGYGYLEVAVTAEDEFAPGATFVEKPDRARAKRYLSGGRHLWNSGIFVWDSGAFLRAAETHIPEIQRQLAPAIAAFGSPGFTAALESCYADCPAASLDYALMEKLTDFTVMKAAFRWSDLGSWEAWGEMAPALGDDNRGRADLFNVGGNGNVVLVPDKVVALVGVDDLIVVETDDALLVCRRQDAQRIKDVIADLEAAGRKDLL